MDTSEIRAPTKLMAVADALERLMSAVSPVEDQQGVPTLEAHGRVLAQSQVSRLDVPREDCSQMDGYAVRVDDCKALPARLPVSQRIPAGHAGRPLVSGTAARIFTGGVIPHGADAVVMQEQVQVERIASGDCARLDATPSPGDWIRRAGEDIRDGSTILEAGILLRAQEIGLAASVGVAELQVFRRLRVAVFFTGDELVMPPAPLKPGAIYNSSRFTLRGLLEALDCEVTDLGIVPDTLTATRQALRDAARGHDCILTSGGVSVGDEDHIRPAVEAEGRIDLWQIAVKPGKPLAFGQVGAAWFIGLPGNPVSSFVTFLLFVRPVFRRLQGVRDVALTPYSMRADFDWPRPDQRQEYLRVRRNKEGGLDLFPNQGSAVLTSTVWGDGLVEVPPGQPIRRGETVTYLPFDQLTS